MALLFRIPPYVQEYTIYIHVIVIMYEYKYNIYMCYILYFSITILIIFVIQHTIFCSWLGLSSALPLLDLAERSPASAGVVGIVWPLR